MRQNYCQQARRTAELTHLLATARASTRKPGDRPLPQRNGLHRSVVKLMIASYEAGTSTYELAERFDVRRNTVRDTLRRAGFDVSGRANRSIMNDEQKAEAGQLFASGATRRELSARYGLSEATIKRAVAHWRTPHQS